MNSSTISRAYSNFKPTMPEDPRPRPRLKEGGRLTYAMLVSV